MNDNSVMVLNPYFKDNTWVFDDVATGLKAEAFVFGIPEMIDYAIAKKKIPNANKGFKLVFSKNALPKYDLKLDWSHEDCGGNWYKCNETKSVGWLCPALFKYFSIAPKELYAFVEPLKI
jgi:hypothetical protein